MLQIFLLQDFFNNLLLEPGGFWKTSCSKNTEFLFLLSILISKIAAWLFVFTFIFIKISVLHLCTFFPLSFEAL